MTATLTILPNIEALVSAHLRAQPEVIALVGDRVYTRLPGSPVMPAVQVHQFYAQNVTQRPLWVTTFYVNVDTWAITKAEAFTVSATVLSAMSERMEGVHTAGIVSGITFDGWMDNPDDFYSPARPRWTFIARITAHPLP